MCPQNDGIHNNQTWPANLAQVHRQSACRNLAQSATDMHDNMDGVTPIEQQFGTGDVREAGRAGEGNCLDV